jgi:hypothetical protein
LIISPLLLIFDSFRYIAIISFRRRLLSLFRRWFSLFAMTFSLIFSPHW